MTSKKDVDAQVRDDWIHQEEAATRLAMLTANFYRDFGVVLTVRGLRLVGHDTIGVLREHKAAVPSADVTKTLPIAEALDKQRAGLGAARIDLARLAACDGTPDAIVAEALANAHLSKGPMRQTPQDVVIYGYGRIGRLLCRQILDKTGSGEKFNLRAIVVRPSKGSIVEDLEKRAALLRTDSVHGAWRGIIQVLASEDALVCNGSVVRFVRVAEPGVFDFESIGVHDAICIDATGAWRDKAGLAQHLKCKGISRVLLTAPGTGDVPNVVAGVNDDDIGDTAIVSAASCTTNAITPVLSVLQNAYGIAHGHIETIHSYTNDQNLLDNFHKKARRGRAAPLNLVLTETGSSEAVARALPALEGKLTGSAIRVPTPNVSLAILVLHLETETTVAEINDVLLKASESGPLIRQIGFSNNPDAASTDFVGALKTGIVDGIATLVNEKNRRAATIYIHYDNEAGYCAQVFRLMQRMAGVVPPNVPAEPKAK